MGMPARAPKDTVIISNLSLNRIVNQALKAHAIRRGGMSVRLMLTDIITLWALYATDLGDPFFSSVLPKNAHFPSVPERYAGYLSSLGFAPAMIEPERVTPPPAYEPLTPAPVPDERPLPPAYQHAEEQATQPVDHPQFGRGSFDATAHERVAKVGRQGPAAVDLGFSPPRREDL